MKISAALPLASPLPTAAPSVNLVQHKLEVRQGIDGSTCGYFNANPLEAATCDFGYTCAINTINSVHGCCSDINSCYVATTCIPSSALSASCNSACGSNSLILKCTDDFYPYCFTNTFISPSIYGFGCASEMLADGTVYPTFSGQSSLLTSLEAAASSLLSEFDQSSVTNNDDVASSLLSELASLTSEASFIQTASSAGFLGGGGGAATTFNSGSSPSSLSTSSNTQSQSQSLAPGIIAAIAVPSAVGAIALAGFIVWLVFYLRRRNRRRRAWQNPMVGPYTQGGQQPPISTYPDTYAVNKDFASPTTVRQLSPSNPSMSVVSPYPSSPGAGELNGAHGPQSAGYHSPGLNRENLDALSATSPSGGGNPRGSDELARGRRLSDDGTTAIPEASVAGRTNWTADSFNVMGGRR